MWYVLYGPSDEDFDTSVMCLSFESALYQFLLIREKYPDYSVALLYET